MQTRQRTGDVCSPSNNAPLLPVGERESYRPIWLTSENTHILSIVGAHAVLSESRNELCGVWYRHPVTHHDLLSTSLLLFKEVFLPF